MFCAGIFAVIVPLGGRYGGWGAPAVMHHE
jgi:hypothetical protein